MAKKSLSQKAFDLAWKYFMEEDCTAEEALKELVAATENVAAVANQLAMNDKLPQRVKVVVTTD